MKINLILLSLLLSFSVVASASGYIETIATKSVDRACGSDLPAQSILADLEAQKIRGILTLDQLNLLADSMNEKILSTCKDGDRVRLEFMLNAVAISTSRIRTVNNSRFDFGILNWQRLIQVSLMIKWINNLRETSRPPWGQMERIARRYFYGSYVPGSILASYLISLQDYPKRWKIELSRSVLRQKIPDSQPKNLLLFRSEIEKNMLIDSISKSIDPDRFYRKVIENYPNCE